MYDEDIEWFNVKIGNPQEFEQLIVLISYLSIQIKLCNKLQVVCGIHGIWHNNKNYLNGKPHIKDRDITLSITKEEKTLFDLINYLLEEYEPYGYETLDVHNPFSQIGYTIGITQEDFRLKFSSFAPTSREKINLKYFMREIFQKRNLNISLLEDFFSLLSVEH